MAGGTGTRLWPISRKSYPKQFSKLIDKKTLFQQAALRLSSSKIVKFSSHITLTISDFRFIVAEQLHGVGIDPGPILIEPEGKNTAPAILAASFYTYERNKDAILLIAPSDHIIQNQEAFHRSVATGIGEVLKGNIVTFGITPTRPEAGYGYLELLGNADHNPKKLRRFIEKPSVTDAKKMLEDGNFLWNSGIFMFRSKDMIEAFKLYHFQSVDPVKASIKHGKLDLGFFRFDSEAWKKCENISIDYAIMEQAKNLVAVPFSEGWSDLGGWDAVWEEMGPDNKGVALSSNAHAIECSNTLLRSESENQEIIGLGLEEIIAIAMPDAVLVAKKNQSENVKKVVSMLKSRGITQAEVFPKDHRPWGWFEKLVAGSRFQVKRILVHPGAAISLQCHHHRSEHWIVVEGTAKVTINEEVKLISEGESVHIPLGAIHRMENPGKVPMLLIEVQTGTYLGEDDIIRYEDIYSRE